MSDEGPTTPHQKFGAAAAPASEPAVTDEALPPTTKHQRRGQPLKPPLSEWGREKGPAPAAAEPREPKWMVGLLIGTIVVTVIVIMTMIAIRYGGGDDAQTDEASEQEPE